MSEDDQDRPDMPEEFRGGKIIRAGMQVVSGAIPFLGGLLGAAAGAWSEHEQNKVRKVFEQWLELCAALHNSSNRQDFVMRRNIKFLIG
jgi:hypothetical protein